MSNQIWPSSQPSSQKASKSTYRPEKHKTDWVSGWLVMAFVVLTVVAVGGGLYHFALAPFFEQLQAFTDSLPMQLVSAVTR
jgi:hypothetical protein